ncbi:larval cuticle protein 9-like [Topomyia yanbarensis]|uniref:larval cuticle protein 9-like n=1 Tax=Topomyia yanbarensis TaxID=2498891 RepID=UPI00273BCCFE|nr:larval cuticle protein 9-like [Topomyia yanbarensis]
MQPELVRLVSLILIFGVAVGAPVTEKMSDTQLKVVEEFNNYKTDEFSWEYELSDGRQVRQNAYIKKLEDGTEVLVISGYYSYTAPDGFVYSVSYYSDENGYHPDVYVGEMPKHLLTNRFSQKLLISLVG